MNRNEALQVRSSDYRPFDITQLPEEHKAMALDSLDRMVRMAQKTRRAERTGIVIATAMRFDDASWEVGTNLEIPNGTIHAETDALNHRRNASKLTHVFVTAAKEGDPLGALKHAVPCEDCTKHIEKYSTPDTKVTMLSGAIPDWEGVRVGTTTTVAKLVESYRARPQVMQRSEVQSVENFLASWSAVRPEDRAFLQSLSDGFIQMLGPAHRLYLTGSAAGEFFGPKAKLMHAIRDKSRPYADIDLVLTASEFPQAVEEDIARLVADISGGAVEVLEVDEPFSSVAFDHARHVDVTPDILGGDPETQRELAKAVLPSAKLPFKSFVIPVRREGDNRALYLDITVGYALSDAMTQLYREKGWYVTLHEASDFSLRSG